MSCCGGNCGCGDGRKCGSGCTGCKMHPDMSYAESNNNILGFGVATHKPNIEGSHTVAEMGNIVAENGGGGAGGGAAAASAEPIVPVIYAPALN